MTEYTISGEIGGRKPNDGVSEVFGWCVKPDGEAIDGMLVRVAWRGQPMVVEAISGPHAGYTWPPGFWSLPLFIEGKTPCIGAWDVWVFDPEHGIETERLQFETDGKGGAVNQVEVIFTWTPVSAPPVTPPDPPLPPTDMTFHDWLLAEGEKEQLIQFNPNAALQKRIFADGFVPNSPEFERTWQGRGFTAQRAERLSDGRVRVYYARTGQWDEVRYAERPA